MGSFIITLKTISRAGTYTKCWDLAPEQGPKPLCSQHQDTLGTAISITPACIPTEPLAANGSSRPRVHLKSQPQCHFIISISLQRGFQGEVCKELIIRTT